MIIISRPHQILSIYISAMTVSVTYEQALVQLVLLQSTNFKLFHHELPERPRVILQTVKRSFQFQNLCLVPLVILGKSLWHVDIDVTSSDRCACRNAHFTSPSSDFKSSGHPRISINRIVIRITTRAYVSK